MRVDFYHLQTSLVEKALPQLLERILSAGHRAVVMVGSEGRVEALADHLWAYDPDAWLPHGTIKDGSASDHPIWLTDRDENPNAAHMLVTMDGVISSRMAEYARCLDLFDGNSEEATTAARSRWSAAKAAGHELHYWQQTATGWKEQGV